MEEESIVIKGLKTAKVVKHVKENNLAYLVGVLISYQMGFLQQVFHYGQGLC